MAAYRRLDVTDEKGKNHDVTVVGFVDREILDEACIQELGQEFFQLVDEGNHRKIVLNFSKVESMSSGMLGKMILFDKKVKAHGGELKLCHIRRELHDTVFAIGRFDKMFAVKADENEAVESF